MTTNAVSYLFAILVRIMANIASRLVKKFSFRTIAHSAGTCRYERRFRRKLQTRLRYKFVRFTRSNFLTYKYVPAYTSLFRVV